MAIAVWFATAAVGVTPAAACIGGTAFDWAVAHQHGGILRATMIGVYGRTDDFTIEMRISATQVLRGDPPLATKVHVVVALGCDQQPDIGETVILVFDVRGGTYPYPLPLAYVVTGKDAIDPAIVSNALSALPATDTATPQSDRRAGYPLQAAAIASGAALAFLIALWRPRRARQSGPR